MRSWKAFLPSFITAALFLLAACASRLEKDKADRTEKGEGKAIDISLLHFTDLESGKDVDLKTFMEREGKEYLLMVFGSINCPSCNHKNEFLRDDVIGKHELFTDERGKAFELVGVNTDVQRLWPQVQLFNDGKHFNFIRLADPQGKTMVRQLLPEGDAFGIPFTVLMTKRGIAWRYTNKDNVEVDEIMRRVAKDMGLDSTALPPTRTPTAPPVLPPVPGRLQLVTSDRLTGVGIHDCSGSDVGNLHDQFHDVDVRYVVAAKNACDSDCQGTIADLQKVCAGLVNGRSCEVRAAVGTADHCDTEMMFVGGKEFFDVFPSFFDWSHPRQLSADQLEVSIAPMNDLVVMGFDRAGQIVFAKEGAVNEAAVSERMRESSFGEPERGPDFVFYGQSGERRFADMRSKAQFTVVNFFDIGCTDCVKDMEDWSKPGKLYDFCASGNDCQVLAFEDQEDYMERPLPEYFNVILNGDSSTGAPGLNDYHVRLPLFLDPIKTDPNNSLSYLPRIYEGYFKGLYGKTNYVGGALVWDKEGKLVDFFGAPFGDLVDQMQVRLEQFITWYAK